MELPSHPFTIRQLQYVSAVAAELSFRKAAARCNVSQPSLSAQLAQLEGAMGVRIFERNRRGVRLTAAGALLLARTRVLLRDADDLWETARKAADPFAGTLRIGVIPTIAPYLLPDVVPALRKAYPRLQFVWREDKTSVLVEKIAAGEVDTAILALEARLGDLEHVVLGKDPFLLAAAKTHPLGKGAASVRIDALDGERVLLLDDGHCFRDQALAVCGKAGAEEAGYRATSLATLVQMAAGGDGLTLLPQMAVPVENRHGALRIRALAPHAPFRTIALVWRRGAAIDQTMRAVGFSLRDSYGKLRALPTRHRG